MVITKFLEFVLNENTTFGNNIEKSIYSLVKYNNGYFKSEKQSEFLRSQLQKNDDKVGEKSSFGNTVYVYAKYDKDGITELYSISLKPNIPNKTIFKRKINNTLSDKELEQLNYIEKLLKKAKKELTILKTKNNVPGNKIIYYTKYIKVLEEIIEITNKTGNYPYNYKTEYLKEIESEKNAYLYDKGEEDVKFQDDEEIDNSSKEEKIEVLNSEIDKLESQLKTVHDILKPNILKNIQNYKNMLDNISKQ